MAIAHTSNGQVWSVSRARTEGWFFVSRERADLAYGRIRLARGFTMTNNGGCGEVRSRRYLSVLPAAPELRKGVSDP